MSSVEYVLERVSNFWNILILWPMKNENDTINDCLKHLHLPINFKEVLYLQDFNFTIRSALTFHASLS